MDTGAKEPCHVYCTGITKIVSNKNKKNELIRNTERTEQDQTRPPAAPLSTSSPQRILFALLSKAVLKKKEGFIVI